MVTLTDLTRCTGGDFKDACASIKTVTMNEETNQAPPIDATLEVDYSTNCTTLYKMIEKQDWESIAYFLDRGYWVGSLWADKVPPAQQARTWVTRFDPDNSTKIKWSHLPLHLAVVVEAPLGVIRRLVEAYPKALKSTDDEHMLPFHLSLRHGSADDVVEYLLSGFPDAIYVKGKNNRSASECAMRSRKKARARMLTALLEKSQQDRESRDSEKVIDKLQERNRYLDELHMKITAIETAKSIVEDELEVKITQLLDQKLVLEAQLDQLKHDKEVLETSSPKAVGHMQHAKSYQGLGAERKIATLEAQTRDFKVAGGQVNEDGARLHSNLAVIEKRAGHTIAREESITALKNNATAFRSKVLESEEEVVTKLEFSAIKKQLQEELSCSKEGPRHKLLTSVKATIDAINLDNVQVKGMEGWRQLRAEIKALKLDILRNELIGLKKLPEEESKSCESGKKKDNLLKAYDVIKIEKNSSSASAMSDTKKEAEMHRSSTDVKKKGLLCNLFRRTKKQKAASTPQDVGSKTPSRSTPTKPPRALRADEISHTSSEPDSECNSSIPMTGRMMSYGNVTSEKLKQTVSNSDMITAPSAIIAASRKLPSGELARETLTVAQ